MRILRAAAVVVLGCAVTLAAQAPNARDDEFARRQYESGMSFMQNRRYLEALKDFQAIIDAFPRSSVADDALLQMALYQLDIAGDLAAAQKATDRLLKEYPDADSTPMGYVVGGRITIAKGRAVADVDAALASFERVPRLFPGADAVPAAGFYAGETLRLARRNDDALARFARVTLEYPRTIWAARSVLASAVTLAQADRASRALEDLQRVRQQFPNSPEAAIALNYNSIVYRLFVKAPSSAFGFSGRYVGSEANKLRDVVGAVVDAAGQTFVAYNKGVAVFDLKGALIKTVPAEDPSAFFVDDKGRVVVARRDLLIADGGETVTLSLPPAPNGKFRTVEEVPSVVALTNGDRLVSDRKEKAVVRFSSAGKYIGNFASVTTDRLAVNRLDDVAMLDRDSKGVAIFDRDGKPLSRIPPKGTGYEFDSPVDLAFDQLGHLYVLDRGRAAVFVFGAKNRLVTTVTVPEKDAGAFPRAQALALDGSGRLYIFDDRAQRIQVYQ